MGAVDPASRAPRADPPPWQVTGAFDLDAAPTLAPATEDTLVDRIKWTTLARVALSTAVLVFAVAMDLGLGPQRAAHAPETLLYQWAAFSYAISFGLLLATHFARLRPLAVDRIALASVVADAAIAGGLVHVTDGLQSLFQFVLPLAVLNAAVVLARLGAMTAASVVSFGIVAMAAGEVGWIELPRWRVAYLSALAPRAPMTGFEVATDLLVQVAASYATALLSAHLVTELDRARRRAVQQRRELTTLRVRYDDVVSSLPDGLLTVNPDGAVTSINPAAEAIIGAPAANLVGKPLRAALPELAEALASPPGEWEISRTEASPDFAPGRTQEVARAVAGGARQILAVRVAPLRDQGGQWGRVVVLRDVTRARERERDHQARERLAAIGAMAAAVAHEIRNPLASISGAVQLLDGQGLSAESDRALMTIVQRETAQLSGWIGEFLDFSRPRLLQLGRCDLAETVAATVEACQQDPRVASHQVSFARIGDSHADWVIQADAVLVRQTVWNLLLNACQAVADGDDRRVTVELSDGGDHVALAVEDAGPGVSADAAQRIFEPFVTTKGGGTGMGLALVARNVAMHRGQVQAGAGRHLPGARFTISLPRRPPADAFGDTGRMAAQPAATQAA